MATIFAIGDGSTLRAIFEKAFPGSDLEVLTDAGVYSLAVHQHGLLRPTKAIEPPHGAIVTVPPTPE